LGPAWISEPIPIRLIGDLYAPILGEDYFVNVNLLSTFDAMIYVDEVTPAELLP
jgi:erythromycin esterase-like protein